jgi:NAD(P)H-hydrate epimerase
MENAGIGIAKEANKLGDSFVIVCGPGNNGGDGFAAARYLKSKPKIFFLAKPKTSEAYENFRRARNYRPVLLTMESLSKLDSALNEADVVIDALFGTGIQGRIREPVRSAIQMIHKSKKRVVAVDIPTGLDVDTGRIPDLAVKADVTVSLHKAKAGLLKNKKNAGRIVVVDIGIHPKSYTHVGKGDFKFNFPGRKKNAHKGEAGRVLVVGGSKDFTGAPYFAAMAALKAGCDLAYVAAPEEPAERVASMAPDLIVYPLESEYYVSKSDVKEILKKKFDVLCIGNGLGTEEESLAATRDIVKKTKKPVVIDGDGLKAVAPIVGELGGNVILTPHAEEFRVLFGLQGNERNAKKIGKTIKPVILLKGSTDIIVQGERVKLNDSGNPYMAKGGTGDILAGLCAGFMAQGVDPFLSACLGALVNGVAGDLAYSEESVSMTASDVLGRIGEVINFFLT